MNKRTVYEIGTALLMIIAVLVFAAGDREAAVFYMLTAIVVAIWEVAEILSARGR